MKLIAQFLRDESGASAAEYALILALISAAIIGSTSALGRSINNVDNSVAASLNNAVAAAA